MGRICKKLSGLAQARAAKKRKLNDSQNQVPADDCVTCVASTSVDESHVSANTDTCQPGIQSNCTAESTPVDCSTPKETNKPRGVV